MIWFLPNIVQEKMKSKVRIYWKKKGEIRVKYEMILMMALTLIIIVGCHPNENSSGKSTINDSEFLNEDNRLDVKNLAKDFTGPDYMGREPGTEGNVMAQDDLVAAFKVLGLQPYEGTYFLPYQHEAYIEQEELEVHVEGETVELKKGEDYLINYRVNHTEMNVPIYFGEAGLEATEDCFIALDKTMAKDSELRTHMRDNQHVKGVLIETEFFMRDLSVQDEGLISVQMSHDAIEKIKVIEDARFHIKTDYDEESFEANNVIGYIPGQNKDACLVISAHFDHVGQVGDLIFPGALDNVSGVYGLLRMASLLQSAYEDTLPYSDILIVAFNGEDSGTQGSKSFVEDIQESYGQIVDINLDCIGDITQDELLLITLGDVYQPYKEFLSDMLQEAGYTVSYDDSLGSDHESFNRQGLPGLTIGNAFNHKIHTKEDTLDLVSLDKIDGLMQTLAKGLEEDLEGVIVAAYTEESDKEGEGIDDSEWNDEDVDRDVINAETDQVEDNLRLGEHTVADIQGEKYHLSKTSMKFSKAEEIKNEFPSMDTSVLDAIGNRQLEEGSLDIRLNIKQDESLADMEIGDVKRYDVSQDMICALYLTYIDSTNEENGMTLDIIKLEGDARELYDSEGFEEIEYDHNGTVYTIEYDPVTKNIISISFILEDEGSSYEIRVFIGKIENWTDDNGRIYKSLKSNLVYDDTLAFDYRDYIGEEQLKAIIYSFFESHH